MKEGKQQWKVRRTSFPPSKSKTLVQISDASMYPISPQERGGGRKSFFGERLSLSLSLSLSRIAASAFRIWGKDNNSGGEEEGALERQRTVVLWALPP